MQRLLRRRASSCLQLFVRQFDLTNTNLVVDSDLKIFRGQEAKEMSLFQFVSILDLATLTVNLV